MLAIATAWLGCLALFLELVWRASLAADRDEQVGLSRDGLRHQVRPMAEDLRAGSEGRTTSCADEHAAMRNADWVRPRATGIAAVRGDAG